MKILITGGCGFLGSNLATHAVMLGHELLIFDNHYAASASANLAWVKSQGPCSFIHGDIRNANDVNRAVGQFHPDAVFHLAGQVAMTTSITNPILDFETNTVGTHNLLEAIRNHAPDACLMYSSTNKVYGDLEQYQYRETQTRYECIDRPLGFDEDTPLNFQSPYGCSKGAADQFVLDYARIYGLKTVVFRHSSMYGGRQFATYDQGWIGWFCMQAVAMRRGRLKDPITISGTGKQVRDVLHADDVVNLYYRALEHISEVSGAAINIGGGMKNSLSLLELFSLIEEFSGVALPFVRIPPRECDQRVFVADIRKAQMMMGWEPLVTARKGVCRMIEWIEETGLGVK
ncbi:MAG: GDP-mannose 4,6-dehydratase [Verrucomicrobia bacterium]|nr:GDP-mannose 4,6-dehydratase [Verrucomicrobiota bacterium]